MNGNNGDNNETDKNESGDKPIADNSSEAGEVVDLGGDTLVSTTAEFKVDEIVAKIDKEDPDESAHKREVRKRIEDISEERDKELDSTFNINLDEDL